MRRLKRWIILCFQHSGIQELLTVDEHQLDDLVYNIQCCMLDLTDRACDIQMRESCVNLIGR